MSRKVLLYKLLKISIGTHAIIGSTEGMKTAISCKMQQIISVALQNKGIPPQQFLTCSLRPCGWPPAPYMLFMGSIFKLILINLDDSLDLP